MLVGGLGDLFVQRIVDVLDGAVDPDGVNAEDDRRDDREADQLARREDPGHRIGSPQ